MPASVLTSVCSICLLVGSSKFGFGLMWHFSHWHDKFVETCMADRIAALNSMGWCRRPPNVSWVAATQKCSELRASGQPGWISSQRTEPLHARSAGPTLGHKELLLMVHVHFVFSVAAYACKVRQAKACNCKGFSNIPSLGIL